MLITDFDKLSKEVGDHALDIYKPTDTCWFCSEMLGGPMLVWVGDSQIWMHRKCAAEFAIKLAIDAAGEGNVV